MKYEYTIFVTSSISEEELVAKLEQAGLEEIFVEKYVNIESLLRDQNNFLDENFDAKWAMIRDSGIIRRKEMLEQIENRIREAECKSMFMLFSAIHEAGVACDLPNAVISVIMSRSHELINQ